MRPTTASATGSAGRRGAPPHRLAHVTGLLLAALVLLLGPGAVPAAPHSGAAPAAAHDGAHRTPAAHDGAHRTAAAVTGTWDLTVTIDLGHDTVTTVTRFYFHPNRTLTTDSTHDSGDPAFAGSGYWTADRGRRFSFFVTHPDAPADPGAGDPGVPTGTVNAVHQGKLKGRSAFTTTASAFVLNDLDGGVLGPIPVSTKAVKVSDSPS
ncbi:hypothetical protein JJV70_10370 [Streptomyces sp. JJ66]|uniref:hypothetical protein n=1 Tax=Streptomyces sp. JJ66 TaxID=2803843 RepID=UPI001C561BAD|nr:hypothetical protein [Streptomyces sp. JJ66]MBW1602507.1 hypothetical protein [Streptomyces sp. JJ66]